MITEGTSESVSLVVSDADTALAIGSGDVAVLGTPRVVGLCEEAAVGALAGQLPDGATSVGTHVSIDHLIATAVGGTVTAIATVTRVQDKKISFDIELLEGNRTAARGTHTRFIVDRVRFEESVS
jgi:fluoroacetyl-CoA thioesterase